MLHQWSPFHSQTEETEVPIRAKDKLNTGSNICDVTKLVTFGVEHPIASAKTKAQFDRHR